MGGITSYIIASRRSANGRIGGIHCNRRLEQLAAPILEAALADARIDFAEVDEVIIGNTTNGGENPARLIALSAGIPEHVPAYTIDRQCASGLEALLSGVRLITSGSAHVVVAGGAETPSTAPWRIVKPRSIYHTPKFFQHNPLTPSEYGEVGMADVAETLARRRGISRERQDNFALKSHFKANAAQDDRLFLQEIVPLRIDATETRDESLRPEITAELLAQMPSLFSIDGTITMGNSAPLNDGAAISVLVSERVYKSLGSPPALKVIGGVAAGVAADKFGLSAVPAVRKLMERSETITLNDVGLVEFNETFAAQILASLDELDLDESKVNKDGGAIALGQPFGAGSSVLVTRLFSRMVRQRTNSKKIPNLGLATLCSSDGTGMAALFEAV